MIAVITGTVIIGGVRYPCEVTVELPDAPAESRPGIAQAIPLRARWNRAS